MQCVCRRGTSLYFRTVRSLFGDLVFGKPLCGSTSLAAGLPRAVPPPSAVPGLADSHPHDSSPCVLGRPRRRLPLGSWCMGTCALGRDHVLPRGTSTGLSSCPGAPCQGQGLVLGPQHPWRAPRLPPLTCPGVLQPHRSEDSLLVLEWQRPRGALDSGSCG